MTSLAIMGSTGSIGTQTLEVLDTAPGRFDVDSLGANGGNLELLAAQARAVHPRTVAIADSSRAAELKELLPSGVHLEAGPDALADVCASADVVVNGVVGFAGLGVTMATLSAGHRLALANKESLIAAGPIVQPLRATPGAELIPVDSEHCAVHQCLRSGADGPGGRRLRSVVLTASGGPFRGRTRADLESVTVEQALAHPTWAMGPKITVDSSTLVNKGLEVIEAHELFGVGYDDIGVVVHPTSIVHSMASFTDGATIAQLSLPDMRLPIGYALGWPDRFETAFGAMDFSQPFDLHFEPPDHDAFPCLGLAYTAGRLGQTAPAWFSAANEIAVEAFLAGRIRWVDIADVNADALERWDGTAADTIEAVLAADAHARVVAADLVSMYEEAR
ncbi:MAG TPA: 1-deoxy-D-xylulose-5-phosphate reductoisomerase [Microthrixaceae bacterium]|nr:1-deoxy-D-xylulose-5-phosphate reductoisomerase [Microthrixaceae bacterium]